MSFYDHIAQIKTALTKKLKNCTQAFIEKEIVNAQLEAIVKQIDELETLVRQKKTKGSKDV